MLAPRPLPPALGAAALIALTLAPLAAPARAFELQKHSQITYQVLGRHGLSGAALSLVVFGALLPDVQDCIPNCYCDFAPSACQPGPGEAAVFGADHFDNNLLDESIFRVNDRMAQARAGISTGTGNSHASGVALLAFGKALHTTQDFYAHSTWVEINIFPGPGITTNISNLPIWQGEPYSLYSWHNPNLSGGGDLQTGFYLQGPPSGGYTHDQLNKDKSGSPEGSQTARVSGVAATNLYGVASGDVTGSGTFTDLGLAPQHTIYAFQALLNGEDVFPYVFDARTPPGGGGGVTLTPQQVEDFFSYVNSDPTLIAMAQAADSLVAHAKADSVGAFPLGSIDADGLPIPQTTSVAPIAAPLGRLLMPARPNPSTGFVGLTFLAPANGRVKMRVFDLEGRRITTLFDGEAAPGMHEVRWNGMGASGVVAPGVYLVRFAGFGREETQRVALTR